MKFETWLKKQKNRDDRVGDLAQDYIRSIKIYPNIKTIQDSLNKWGACSEAWESYGEAKKEWELL